MGDEHPTGRPAPGQADDGLLAHDDGEAAFGRPHGVSGGFAPRQPEPLYSPPPPTVSPHERVEFARPAGSSAEFAPLAGERIRPAHTAAAPVHPELTRAFGRTEHAGRDGFDPEPGSRIGPGGPTRESPWWKPDARHDPWRDPYSPFWLGRPAVFSQGAANQLDPELDTEQADEDVAPEPDADEAVARPGRRARFGLSALLLAVLVALIAGSLGGGAGYWLANRAHSMLTNPDVKLAQGGTPANRPPGSVADIARRVSPAVVSIQETTQDVVGVGSGVVIDKHGYILTNNHVISAAASGGTIRVTFADKSRQVAKIVGRDPVTDLAVLKVEPTNLTVATLGDSSKLAVGDPVIAIGSPLGLSGTVTSGIVSALNRPVHVAGEGNDPDVVFSAIQTDAAINPGNSGGALVDASGTVIGVNSANASLPSQNVGGSSNGNIGLGFAIPIDQARQIATELIHTGEVAHASIGLSSRSVTDGSRDGAYILQVVPGGPADKAGLKEGDVITLVDHTLIDSADELTVTVQSYKPGNVVTVHFFRGNSGEEVTVKVTLGNS